jgi:prepilin-type processing-associated H-X9-DG protein
MRRGFTVVELIAVILIVVFLGALFLTLTPRGRSGSARPLMDAAQLRNMTQAMVVWANSNNGEYPLPSAIDVNDLTVADTGRAKDTTANIFSILVFNGSVTPEQYISHAESNTFGVQSDLDYQYTNPTSAVNPADALWDPAFSADFTGGSISNFSYAHLQPSGIRGNVTTPSTGRLLKWRDTSSSKEALLGNRAPELSAVKLLGKPKAPASYTPVVNNPRSNTFLIHGGRSGWEGNIAFNDGHAEFIRSLRPFIPTGAWSAPAYTSTAGTRLDTIFFDEPDDTAQTNTFLGIFTAAGEKSADFKAIWD